jgi:hypothetical protein
MRRSRWALVLLRLALASPALADPVRCLTYEEKTPGRLQTLCDDGTRAVSTWSPTWQRWQTTIMPPPGQTCQGRLNPRTRQWERRCRRAWPRRRARSPEPHWRSAVVQLGV